MREQHPLFIKYPLDKEIQLGEETLSSPYHIYNGSIFFIGGRANAQVANDLLQDERLTPILDTDGNALMAVWVCDFTEANLGPHHELQISLFASFRSQPPVKTHPFAIYRLLTLNPDAMMVCHGLWNSTERVVRYNREHLGLDAHLSKSHIATHAPHQWRFEVEDANTSRSLIQGDVILPERQPSATLSMMSKLLGLRGLIRTIRAPFIHVPVVNTQSAYATDNRVAHTYTRADSQRIFTVNDGVRVTLQDPKYAPLQFQPDFVQFSDGVRFVYLRPE